MSTHAGRLATIGLVLALGACANGAWGVNLAPTPDGPDLERQVFAQVNAHRVARRLRPLAWSEVAAEQARQHSRRMASGATSLGHRDFRKRVAAIGRAVAVAQAAENVAKAGSAARAVELWLRNRGHRQAATTVRILKIEV